MLRVGKLADGGVFGLNLRVLEGKSETIHEEEG